MDSQTISVVISIVIVIIVIIYFMMSKKSSSKHDAPQLKSSSEYNTPPSKSSSEHNISQLKNTNDTPQLKNTRNKPLDNYFDFENKYWEKINKQLENYYDYCYEVSDFFDSNFNINQRIKKLQTCINKMEKIKNYYYDLGVNGQKLFEYEAEDYFKSWSKDDIIVNENGDDYHFEFEKIPFDNYNFLTYLLDLYTNDAEEQKKHLKQEAKYYEIFEAGGTESYEEEMEHKRYLDSIRKTIIKKLKSSDNVIQSKLINEFVDDDKYYVRKILKEMEINNEIAKEKKGNSYIITYIKK